MNLIKKTILIVTMLIICCVPSYAETQETYTDNFNQYTADQECKSAGYPNTTYGQSSDVFVASKNYSNAKIVTGMGKDSSTALEVSQRSAGDVSPLTRGIDTSAFSEGGVIEFTYDIMFVTNSTDTSKAPTIGAQSMYGASPLFKLKCDNGTWKITETSDKSTYTDAFAYDLDTWYKVVIREYNDKKYGWIIDGVGNVLASSSFSKTMSTESFSPIFIPGKATSAKVIIDNAVLKVYDINENEPSCVSSTIEDGEGDTPRNKALTFEFDQEIEEDSVVTLYRIDSEGNRVQVTGTTTVRKIYNTLSVTYSGLLERKTDYVISFENVSNGGELNCSDEISFTTEYLHPWEDISVSSKATNDDDDTLTDITFTIGDEYDYPIFTGSVMAVVYQGGTMLKADIQPLTNKATGELTVSFDLGDIPAESEIGIILLDVQDNAPIPLAGGMLEN